MLNKIRLVVISNFFFQYTHFVLFFHIIDRTHGKNGFCRNMPKKFT